MGTARVTAAGEEAAMKVTIAKAILVFIWYSEIEATGRPDGGIEEVR